MVLVTTGIGAILVPGRIVLPRLALTVTATAAVVAAANALNMYLERDVDARMARTRTRPLPSGRLSPEVALWFGVVLAFTGISALTFLINPLSGLLSALAISLYVLVYTPLKRVTPYALHVFAILLVWQIPHFLAIAIFRASEYEAAGLAVYPSVRGVPAAKRAVIAYSFLLLVVSGLPVVAGLGATWYLGVAVVLGVTQIVIALRGLVAPDLSQWARSLFYATLPYLLVVYGALALTAS
jgi:protoheme IX farnesyltransferase